VHVLGGFVASQIEATGAVVNISGGSGNGIRAYGGSEVHFSGGSTGRIQAESGSVVDVTGGIVVNGIEVYRTATVNISGGIVQRFNNRALLADADSELNISGGTFSGRDMFIGNGAMANISGGLFDLFFLAGNGSEINLAGSSFLLDGVPIDGLQLGLPLEILDRDVLLTGTWDNGLPFSFDLSSTLTFTSDTFLPGSTLMITLVAPDLLPGDYNDDGIVNAADYVVWRNHVDTETSLPNDETPGMVTAEDYTVWADNFGTSVGQGSAGGGAVPEPATCWLIATFALYVASQRRR
jgi:hypothetical protein